MIIFLFSELKERTAAKAALPDTTEIDMHNYFGLTCEPRSSDPLDWWTKEGKTRFPQMYKMAVKYLTIPATSVPSERVFSAAGEIISKKRNQIGDDNARMLIVLHGNMEK